MHLNELADRVKEGVQAAGLVGMRFNTIGVSDGISMGTEGMSYSLQSRDLIADSIETVMHAQWYDANISLPGCDKNMPGCLIAMGRLNRPALMVYGGTIKPGHLITPAMATMKASRSTSFAPSSATAKYLRPHRRGDAARHRAPCCPGAGACGGMYTANTMASAIEALGMSLPYSSSIPAEDPGKLEECFAPARRSAICWSCDLKPRDIMTRRAFENAMVVVMALGGSTNAVLHLIAMARAVEVPLTIDDFQRVSDRVPYLADLKPSGKFVQEDLHNVGGTPAVMKYLLEERSARRRLHDGHRQDARREPRRPAGSASRARRSIHPLEKPIKPTGHIQILRGNLAPDGAVAKITGKEGLRFAGPARVYDSEEDMLRGLEQKQIKKGDVVIIRYEGPQGRPRHARDAHAHLRDHGRRAWARTWRC